MVRLPPFIISLLLLLISQTVILGQPPRTSTGRPAEAGLWAARDREVAVRFAPVFYQALGDQRRSDYITNFDFDGDWRGDNNWANADVPRFKLLAYVYFAVSETPTHYFIHYAVFHPRDYKGGKVSGPLLSGAIREGVRRGGRYDPTGLSKGAVLAHENDMEGCLVVAAKGGKEVAQAKVLLVETLSHDRFLKYTTDENAFPGLKLIRLEDQSPLLYVEPKGHGVSAYSSEKQLAGQATLTYRYTGQANDPENARDGVVGYELLPMFSTLWARARSTSNGTFADLLDYGVLTFNVEGQTKSRRKTLGKLGSAFLGRHGAPNAARPPWGWFDRSEGLTPGSWFFDPASAVKRRHNLGAGFSTSYLHAPFIGLTRK